MRTCLLRRVPALILALVCCLSLLPGRAETYPLTAYTTASLRLRQQPSTSASVLLTIPSGDMVLITGESGTYYIVSYEGTQGYAQKQYLTVVEGGVNLPAVTPAPASTTAIYPVLYNGSTGEAVIALQEALKELGFLSGAADGKFGSGTRAAVLAFQAMNGLGQTGTADGETQALLYEGKPKNVKGKAVDVKTVAPVQGAVISQDSRGTPVSKLQERLLALGYYTGVVDGVAGKGTVSAIKTFQKKNGLSQTGRADAATQALLYSDQAIGARATAKPAATPTPLPTAAPEGEATYPYSTYTTSSVNLRQSASTSSTRLGTVPKGGEITVLSVSGNFLKVTYGKLTGYILAEYAYIPPQYAPGKALASDAGAQQRYDYLQSGSAGKSVMALQEALKELGFYAEGTDGNFGAATTAALKAFQQKNSIRQDGIASPEVQKLIFEGKPLNARGKKTTVMTLPNYTVSELKVGNKGEQVSDLQQRLKEQGFYTAAITGQYDTATQNAVKKFQTTHKLASDGVAGAKTLQLLYLLTATPSPAPYGAVPVAPAVTPLTADNVVVMRKGTKGTEVTRLQYRLMELGYYVCTPDGVYDDDEIAAIKEFQRRSGLKQDGVAGLATQQALYSDFAVAVETPVPVATLAPQYVVAGSPTPIVVDQGVLLQTLKEGSSGELVSALQTRLKALGYYTGTVDGSYGSGTARAVKEFQRRNGLDADGVAGRKTLEKIYTAGTAVNAPTAAPTAAPKTTAAPANGISATALKTGDSGAAVKAMQQRLVQLGYLATADGVYGPRTYNAVAAFQKKNGLTADGIAGTMTLNRLSSANAISSSGSLLVNAAATQTAANNTRTGTTSTAFSAPAASRVKYENWYSVIRPIAKTMPDVVIYDPDIGLHFNLHMFSFGKHADCETPTAADTAVLNQVVGVNSWTPKYVWVCFPDGQVYIGSIHSHGHEVDHTPNNNLEGHICLHFPRVMSEAEQTGPYAVSHQKEINWGWELTKAMAK